MQESQQSTNHVRPKHNLPFLYVGGITLLALILRLSHLDFNSIWLDEAFTYFYIQQGWIDIFRNIATDCHPPLFYWITKLVIIFGSGDWWLRLLPTIIGTATIPVFYFIGREFSDGTAIVTGLLLAVSPFHIAYSQEARMYTLLLFVFSLSFLYFLRRRYIIAAVFGGLCFWTHFYSAISYMMLWVLQEKDRIKSAVVYTITILPLLAFAIAIYTGKTGGSPEWGWPGYHLVVEGLRQILGYGFWLPAIMAVLMILGCCYLWGNDRTRLMQFLIFVAGIAMASMIISFLMPMTPRYLITLMPVLLLLASLGIKEADKVGPVLLAIVLVLSLISLYGYYSTPVKDDWRPVVSIVQDAPVAVVGPEFGGAYQTVEMYHSLPLQYYCPSCNIVQPDTANYIIAVNNARVDGIEIYNQSGLRVYRYV
jgi:mannosyltransferase